MSADTTDYGAIAESIRHHAERRFAMAAQVGQLRGTIKLALITLDTAAEADSGALRILIDHARQGLREALALSEDAQAQEGRP